MIPLLFIADNLWIVAFSLLSRMLPGVFGAATIGLGVLLYRFFRQLTRDGVYRKRKEVSR